MTDWRHAAACRDEDPELFFPLSESSTTQPQIDKAKAVCARCAVREECLRHARDTDSRDGIWGGVNLKGRAVRACARPGCDWPNTRRMSAYCSGRCYDLHRYARRRQEMTA